MDPCNRVSPGNRAVRVYLRSIVNPAMGNGGYNAWIRPMALIWETVRTIMAICFIFSTLFINSFPSIEIIPQDMSLSEPPCSHFETVCRTTFSLTASACCDSPFDFLIAFRFSQSTKTSLFFPLLPLLYTNIVGLPNTADGEFIRRKPAKRSHGEADGAAVWTAGCVARLSRK